MSEIVRADFDRLEDKVDKLAESLNRLILIEERQSAQGERIGKTEARLSATEVALITNDRKVDQWINRGIGIWAFATVLFALYKSLNGGTP